MAIKVIHDQFSEGMYRLSKDDLEHNCIMLHVGFQKFLNSDYNEVEEGCLWAAKFDSNWYALDSLDAAQTQKPDWATHVFIYQKEDK